MAVLPKHDVCSYGVLLMKTFTKKKQMFARKMSLGNWVKKSLPHGLTEVIDANLVQDAQAFSAKMDLFINHHAFGIKLLHGVTITGGYV